MTFLDSAALSSYIVLFAFYAFLGWLLEVAYRSYKNKRFINAGFLFGPFLPIYAAGAFFVLALDHLLQIWPWFLRFLVFAAAVTALEYLVGFFSEKLFKLKLWDYSENRFNIQGRVCLRFSLLWAALVLIFVLVIHPAVLGWTDGLDEGFLKVGAVLFAVYIATDATFSVLSLAAFRRKVAYLYTEYVNLSNVEVERLLGSIRRLREAFPDLNKYIRNSIDRSIKDRIQSLLKPIQKKIILEMQGRKPFEKEYYDLIADICEHEEFLKLKEYFHHNSSIYHHVHDVAYLAYRISKYLKLDYRSATRGALLHDFFLYDWRNHDVPDLPREKFHGLEHPKIAVANAKRHFSLNDIEEDIIRKHMWPLTLVPPKYKESFIVSFADKYLSSKEFLNEYKKRIHLQARKITGRDSNKHPENSC